MKTKALLLLNMGGPNDLSEVKLFLSNMFNDKRIISAPQPIRTLIAWFITSLRHKDATHNYSLLGGKSPIVDHTRRLVRTLETHSGCTVRYAMRYTPPFTSDVLHELASYDEIHAIPMYPHFSSTTTSSSFDDLYQTARYLGIVHKIKTIDAYYSHPDYIESIVGRIRETVGDDDPCEFELIFSAHGLPQKVIDRGDPYQRHVRYNIYHARKALAQAGIHFHKTHLAYQSRLGPMEWIRPYLDDKLASLEKKKVILYPIAFTVDNSETECELEIEYREKAYKLGLEEYRVAKAPNDHPAFVECLNNLSRSLEDPC